MLSINTNLSSLIAQNSLKDSTSILNQAVERMTTGYKINHAKDNAANYSISTNMQTQIQSYDVAADNVAMGMDLVTTASDIVSNMQDKANRLQSLCIQARNGTYGTQTMAAINSEAAAIMAEINRLYSTAEYNNISLFNRKAYEIADHLPQAGESGFIEEPVTTFAMRAAATPTAGIEEGEIVGTTTEAPKAKAEYNGFIDNPKTYTDEEVAAMTRVKDVSSFSSGQKYAIYTKEELEKFRDYVNSGNSTSGVEFVLGADIDLSSISNWTPIGYDYGHSFRGTFDGNGHVIKNLTIDNSTEDCQGLFGYITGAIIKNVALKDVDINAVSGASYICGLVGAVYSYSDISNCYATGNVTASGNYVGGLIGYSNASTISNSYAACAVSGTNNVGGLAGSHASNSIDNCYATGNVTASGNYVGGLVGNSCADINNSYATGNVSGVTSIGGLVGHIYNASTIISNSFALGMVYGTDSVAGLVGSTDVRLNVSNCYVNGQVSASGKQAGGLVGYSNTTSLVISNSYVSSDVTASGNYVGGLVGYSYSSYKNSSLTISNSYTAGNVSSSGNYVGGLVGGSATSSSYSYTINNSYTTGNVSSSGNYVGGLIGYSATYSNSSLISACYATGTVSGANTVGGLAGNASTISNSYATGTVSGDSQVGGLAGNASTISNSYATGTVSGANTVGGLAGNASTISNSYATGMVSGDSQVGGLAGNASTISNSYAIGNVSGNDYVGGLIGVAGSCRIDGAYSTGNVEGDNKVGGLIGEAVANYEGAVCDLSNSISYSQVSGNTAVGSLVGSFYGTMASGIKFLDGSEDYFEESGELIMANCQVLSSDLDAVGDYWKSVDLAIEFEDPDTGNLSLDIKTDGTGFVENYDFTSLYSNISYVPLKPVATNLQVGINSDSSCQIGFDTNFDFDLSAIGSDISSDSALACINDFLTLLSEKSTMLGAVENRLNSALESIEVNIENLTSSLSTIRDADIAEVSSTYIQQQILQQAASTLLATANQSPSIALQLI